MILRPLLAPWSSDQKAPPEPAWQIISRSQNIEAPQYLLIGQPEHARLSGELASRFRADFLPAIDDAVVKAIAVHDDGWGLFPFERDLRADPELTHGGRPQHFMQVTVEQSLAAWTGSIESGGKTDPLGEFMVSSHFSRIGKMRIEMQVDTAEDVGLLESFVCAQEESQRALQAGHSPEQLSQLVDLLQFCDLLSLYLCCGSTAPVEFPQQFGGHQVSLRYDDGVFKSEPSLFAGTAQRFSLPVRLYPGTGRTRVGFHVK